MEYQIIRMTSDTVAKAVAACEAEVRIAIKSGWKPQGGASVVLGQATGGFGGAGWITAQVMVKE